MNWQPLIRERIAANLARNPALTESQKAATLEAEVGKAIAATDSGQPLNPIAKPAPAQTTLLPETAA